jgi:tetratricopeptide (TPR) repeat protein
MGVVAATLLLVGCATNAHKKLDNVVSLRRNAANAYAAGEYAKALAGYRQLADTLPGDADVWFRLGNIYAHLNRPQQADEAYLHVLQREPGHARAWHNLGVMYLHQAQAAFLQSAHAARDRRPALSRQGLDMARRVGKITAAAAPGSADAPEPAARLNSARRPAAAPAGGPRP